ncbi:MAG TPA: ATP-binding protein [Candidatus Baltobacteraceae bacterium]|jgi:anti-sigma regulatory factor (Ser/Thr protein kinase)
MEWYFRAADAAKAVSERRAFTKFLRARCTPGSDCQAAEIVFGELVANVVRHAPGPIEIMLRSTPRGAVTLEVCDTAAHFKVTRPTQPPLNAESGRGLYVIWHLCGNLSRTKTPTGGKMSVVLPVVRLQTRNLDDGSQKLRELRSLRQIE